MHPSPRPTAELDAISESGLIPPCLATRSISAQLSFTRQHAQTPAMAKLMKSASEKEKRHTSDQVPRSTIHLPRQPTSKLISAGSKWSIFTFRRKPGRHPQNDSRGSLGTSIHALDAAHVEEAPCVLQDWNRPSSPSEAPVRPPGPMPEHPGPIGPPLPLNVLPSDQIRPLDGVNVANAVVSGSGLSSMVTGEVLHALLEPGGQYFDEPKRAGVESSRHSMARFPPAVWTRITFFSPTPLDAANLLFATLKLRGQAIDADRPEELFCYLCGVFHHRLHPDQECLRPNYVNYPIYECPNAKVMTLPRMRLVEGRQLPYSLVQLAMRQVRYGPRHGVALKALSRRWQCKDSEWVHISRAHVYKGHLIVKVTSTVYVRAEMTPSEERLLLFSRNDYAPYFSCCAHWANGRLIPLVKCALSHTPIPRQGIRSQWAEGSRIKYDRLKTPDYMPHLCEQCRPMRRCPECPTEYLVELKLVEDKRAQGIDRFRHALVVTRWSDLGDGTSPSTREFAACNGNLNGFDSFAAIANLSLCSAFEAATSNATPNQRLLSLGNAKPDLAQNLADAVY